MSPTVRSYLIAYSASAALVALVATFSFLAGKASVRDPIGAMVGELVKRDPLFAECR